MAGQNLNDAIAQEQKDVALVTSEASQVAQLQSEIGQLQLAVAALQKQLANPNAPTLLTNIRTIQSGAIDVNSQANQFVQSKINLGKQGSGVALGNIGGWTVGQLYYSIFKSGVRGIDQAHSYEMWKLSGGDSAIIYGYNHYDGGLVAQSDEGACCVTMENTENEGYFHGTVASTTGRGDRAPKWAFTSGNNWNTDFAYMLNISKGTIKGNVLGPAQPFQDTFLNYLPVTSGILPISTACGVCAHSIDNQGVTADSPVSCNITVTLKPIQGVLEPFVVGKHVVVGGVNFVEQSFIDNVVDQGNGLMTLTLKLRYPNQAAVIFQEGIAGQYISSGANLRFSGMRSSYPALGSLTGSDLIFAVPVKGNVVGNIIPARGGEAFQCDGGPDSDIELFPGAEVVASPNMFVQAGTYIWPTTTGTLEQNNVDWAFPDVVENPHCLAAGGINVWFTKTQNTPSNAGHGSVGFQSECGGYGFGGGNVYSAAFFNKNPAWYYDGVKGPNGKPGPLGSPYGIMLNGPHSVQHFSDIAHGPGGATHRVNAPFDPNNPNAIILDKQYNWLSGANLWFIPEKGYWQFDGPLNADSGLLYKGNKGVFDSLKLMDGRTATVQGGIITFVE